MPSRASSLENAFTIAFVKEAREVILPRVNISSMTADVKECGVGGPGDVHCRFPCHRDIESCEGWLGLDVQGVDITQSTPRILWIQSHLHVKHAGDVDWLIRRPERALARRLESIFE